MSNTNINSASVSESAFYGKKNITSVKFGSKCKTIGKNAFADCISLSEINSNNVINEIGDNAFANTALKSVTFNELPQEERSNIPTGSGIFENCSKLSYVNIPTWKNIPSNTFLNCTNLISINANECRKISSNAFKNCSNLSYVNIPKCTDIGSIFKDHKNLTSIYIDSCSSIRSSAFENCIKLNDIRIGKDCGSIGSNAFKNCSNLTSIALTSSSSIHVYESAFESCVNLESVNIPILEKSHSYTIAIGNYAFKDCTKLSNIKFKLLNYIGECAFENCVSLKNIDLNECSIGSSAFISCTNISKVIFENCNDVGNSAFFGCDNLKKVYVINNYDNKILSLGENVFYTSILNNIGSVSKETKSYTAISEKIINDIKIYVKYGTKSNYKSVSNWSNYYNNNNIYEFLGSNQILYKRTDNNEIKINSDENKFSNFYNENTSVGLINFKSDVESLSEKMFSGCDNLSSIYIPYTCKDIKSYAFENCENLCNITFTKKFFSLDDYTSDESTENNLNRICEFAFKKCTQLNEFKIPEKVKSIGEGAFCGCGDINFSGNSKFIKYNGKAIVSDNTLIYMSPHINDNSDVRDRFCDISKIYTNITKLGKYCFYGCKDLIRIDIPSNITSIDEGAFGGCESLYEIHFNGDTPPEVNNIFKNIDNDNNDTINKIKIFVPEDSLTTYIKTFENYNNVDIYPKPKNNKSIIVYYDNSKDKTDYEIKTITQDINISDAKIKTIIVGEGITTLNTDIFNNCILLEYIYLPESISHFGDKCFYDCRSLTSIRIPSYVESFGEEIFYGCSNLQKFISYWKDSVTEDERCYINGDTLMFFAQGGDVIEYEITNNNIKKIYKTAFKRTKIQKININKVESIGYGAFEESNLITIFSDEDLTSIGDYAFAGCANLKYISIPEATTYIGDYAFAGCTNMYTKTNLNKITYIGEGAFLNCTNFKYNPSDSNPDCSETIELNIETINKETFKNCTLLNTIEFTKNVTHISEYAFDGCTSLKEIIINDTSNLTSIGNCAFQNCSSLGTFNLTITDNLTSIGDYAFYNCKAYDISSNGEIPKNLTTIGNYCFSKSGIKKFIIPASKDESNNNTLTTIGSNAFKNCNNLIKVDMSKATEIKTIYAYTFYNCEKLSEVSLPISGLMKIDDSAFEYCKKIGVINLPKSLIFIGHLCLATYSWETSIYASSSRPAVNYANNGLWYPFGIVGRDNIPKIYVDERFKNEYKLKWRFYNLLTYNTISPGFGQFD